MKHFKSQFAWSSGLILTALTLSACPSGSGNPNATPTPASTASASNTPASGAAASVDGITLPAGFAIQVFADGVGPARHMVTGNGNVYVRLSSAVDGKCMVALRDTNNDGRADQTERFGDGESCGTGLAVDKTHLYYSTASEVWRSKLPTGSSLFSTEAPERIVMNLGNEPQHDARSLALDGKGHVYVNVGAPSNACQNPDRTPGVPGQDPCPLLSQFGGIWRFDIDKKDQPKTPDKRYATGIRNAVALDWNQAQDKLFLLQHGRDQLDTMFPNLYNAQQNSELPAEEFTDVAQGTDLGWPYCYYDPAKSVKVLGPEYGGKGTEVGRCADAKKPLVAFPAHYAPNDLLFYTGGSFPPAYQGGAFIAFHGSWNRGTQQEGYNVVFVPFNQATAGQQQTFANGFAGPGPIASSASAVHRPMGLAQTPDGGLLVVDSKKGRIWKITYTGS